jgi:pimeloyl-ACP methyl ester carboxylesterase
LDTGGSEPLGVRREAVAALARSLYVDGPMTMTMTRTTERLIRLPSGVRTRLIDAGPNEGKGPVALLLHGNPDNADEWRHVIALLSATHRCLAPDLPGYGRRGQTQALPAGWEYTVDAQVEFVDQVLAEAGVARVTLVVHDIGGIMGVPWAARNTSRLDGLVYTNTVAYPGFEWFPLAHMAGSVTLAGRIRSKLAMEALSLGGGRLFQKQFGDRNPQLPPDEVARFTRDFGLNSVAKETTRRQFKRLVHGDYFAGYDRMLKTIADAVPTRTVWGLGDPYVPDARAPELLAERLERLVGVGHWVPIVAADTLVPHIRDVVGDEKKRPAPDAGGAR